ncbi:phosphomannomutase [Amaricoccus macauensis]|uniref:phosphomannomutase n=1 Tax=Amaricoccus macauensis TaxID=57001 RepID=UPI003C7AB188
MKFGTSGLRGLVSDMTGELVTAYTAAFLRHLETDGAPAEALLVGRDLRPSSERIAGEVLAAAEAAGVQGVQCGVLPTPALALESAARGLPALMVTGSHIPFDYNGLKFYRATGEITKADEAGITAALADAPTPLPAPVSPAEDDAARRRYIERITGFFAPDALAGTRIGVYQHSAAGRDVLTEILEGLGAEVIAFGRTDGFIPIDTEAVRPEDEALAREKTASERLDAMVSTDGDGDRPLMADEAGTILRGDILGVLTAQFLGADAVATPISSNTALERTGAFAHIARTRIGSPYVIAAMEELEAAGARLVVGFEANGGFLLGGDVTNEGGAVLSALPTRDAVVPLLATLVAAKTRGLRVSELVASLPARYTASDRLKEIGQDRSGPLLAGLAAEETARRDFLSGLGLAPAGEPDTSDGVRMGLEGDEILHLRPSGNAPELRCYAEAASPERARDLVARTLEKVAAELR